MDKDKQQKIPLSIEGKAYRKIIYHALRYPSSKVYGVLTGKSTGTITNGYPLFHTALVNPTLSIAMDIVESNLEKDQKIVALYEFVDGSDGVLGRIIENTPGLKGIIPLRVWANEQNQIKIASAGYQITHPQYKTIFQGVKKGEHRLIVDFDAHLQEIELDFRNLYIK